MAIYWVSSRVSTLNVNGVFNEDISAMISKLRPERSSSVSEFKREPMILMKRAPNNNLLCIFKYSRD